MSKVFLSFRSEESISEARNLYQSLKEAFGKENIFFFPESNTMGDKFKVKIFQALEESKIFIVLIGDKYVNIKNKEGNQRLFQASDLVRQELEYALKNNMVVIPILIENAPFPEESQLPVSLKELAELEFLRISIYKGYELFIQQLISTISQKSNLKEHQSDKSNFFKVGLIMAFVAFILALFVSTRLHLIQPKPKLIEKSSEGNVNNFNNKIDTNNISKVEINEEKQNTHASVRAATQSSNRDKEIIKPEEINSKPVILGPKEKSAQTTIKNETRQEYKVSIPIADEDLTITVNNEIVGKTFMLPKGSYLINIKKPNYHDFEKTIIVKEHDENLVNGIKLIKK